MKIDLNSFLHSLAKWIVAQAAAATPAVAIPYSLAPTATVPNGLFRHEAVEAVAADPYTVLRLYGGPAVGNDPIARYALQVLTVAAGNDAASSRAQTVFEAFLAADQRSLWMQEIPAALAADDSPIGAFTIVACDIVQRPGLIARDERGRANWIFNLDIEWTFAAA